MDPDTIPYRYLSETIGIPIEIILNDFNEFHGNEHQKIVFQVKEEEPDLFPSTWWDRRAGSFAKARAGKVIFDRALNLIFEFSNF
ncbi:MAG: hypothetical protein JRG74_03230 [Deltaproteobacteria bacterium]|nr:hypothetical protein [Deltaproteobacteria bacterium]MBW1833820.1 hypothetical protein [Deltaproteobacteria bacterium]MBW2165134.1 hypothetical protein [Deltaproteobacteria bacterium]